MRRTALAALILLPALAPMRPASADQVYVALGDSITFGETNLAYVPSNGDRGYVGLYADYLASRNGGVRPGVVNLAIDGETASSFVTGAGRVPPVTGRTDAILAAENTHYNPAALVSQNTMFLSTVAAEKAAGNTISTISITLGFNDLATALTNTSMTPSQILANYQMQYSSILSEIRQQAPTANLLLVGDYNPFPADPTSPAAPLFDAYGNQLNSIIRGLASQYAAAYVDTATPFIGHEAQYTYIAQQPAGSTVGGPYGGVLPIGNVHANALGYQVIATQLESVPEPASVVLFSAGCLAVLVAARKGRGGPDGGVA